MSVKTIPWRELTLVLHFSGSALNRDPEKCVREALDFALPIVIGYLNKCRRAIELVIRATRNGQVEA